MTRRFLEAAKQVGADKRTQSGGWSGAKGGEITIDEPGQHILERSSVLVNDRDGCVEARFSVAMPARGELLTLGLCFRVGRPGGGCFRSFFNQDQPMRFQWLTVLTVCDVPIVDATLVEKRYVLEYLWSL